LREPRDNDCLAAFPWLLADSSSVTGSIEKRKGSALREVGFCSKGSSRRFGVNYFFFLYYTQHEFKIEEGLRKGEGREGGFLLPQRGGGQGISSRNIFFFYFTFVAHH